MAKKNANIGSFKSWRKSIVSNPFALLPLVYFLWMISSMFQQYFRMDAFGINIFHFAATEDFVLTPMKDPAAFAFVASTVVLLAIYFLFAPKLLKALGTIAEAPRWFSRIPKLPVVCDRDAVL